MSDRSAAADAARMRALVPFPFGGDLAAAADDFVRGLRFDGAREVGERCVVLPPRQRLRGQYVIGRAAAHPEAPVTWVEMGQGARAELQSHCVAGRYPAPVVTVVDGEDPTHPAEVRPYLPQPVAAAFAGGVAFTDVRRADPWALGIIAWVVATVYNGAPPRDLVGHLCPALIPAPPEVNHHRLEAARGAGLALGVNAALDVLRAEGVLP